MTTPAIAKKLKQRLAMAKKQKVLILNFLELTAIPDEFSGLTGITEVRLRGNKLRALPDWMSEWTTVKELDLGINPIAELPAWLSSWKQLTQLLLEDTKIPEKDWPALAKKSQASLDKARARND